jgi:hypothetical protein
VRRPAIALTLALASAGTAAAQQPRLEVSAIGLGFRSTYRIRFGSDLEEQSGFWYGGQGSLRIGPVALGGRGLLGTLDTSGASSYGSGAGERKVRLSAVWVRFTPRRWLALGPEAEARRYESNLSNIVVRLVGGTLQLAPDFGSGLAGIAEIAYFPSTKISSTDKLKLVVRGEFGFRYAPPWGPLVLQVVYRFERYDFEETSQAPPRLEQLSGVLAGVGVRFAR